MFVSGFLPVLQMSTLNSLTLPKELTWVIKDEKYCALLKDGKMLLLKENETVTTDITLKDGSIMTKDGTVMRKNGTNVLLQNGDRMDEQCNVLLKDKKTDSKEKVKDSGEHQKEEIKNE